MKVAAVLHQKGDKRLALLLNAALNKEQLLLKLNFLLTCLSRVGHHVSCNADELLMLCMSLLRISPKLEDEKLSSGLHTLSVKAISMTLKE